MTAREELAEENPDALWPDGFEDAFIGVARRPGLPALAAFSVRKAIGILIARDGMDPERAEEFFCFNVHGAWVGPGTPIWIDDLDRDDEPFLGPEDLPSGPEDSWPAPDTTTLTDTVGAIPPGTVASTAGSTGPAATTSSASDAGTSSRS